MAVERLHEPGKRRPGLLPAQDWCEPLLRLVDGGACHILEVNDCFRTDQPNAVYAETSNAFLGWASSWDFTVTPPNKIKIREAFDFDDWLGQETDEPIVFTTTVYNFEVEDWHTYFVGTTGLLGPQHRLQPL